MLFQPLPALAFGLLVVSIRPGDHVVVKVLSSSVFFAFVSKKETEKQYENMHRRTNTLRVPEGWDLESGPRRVGPKISRFFPECPFGLSDCRVKPRETQAFLRQAKAKARSEPVPQQARARGAWLVRWRAILACSSARAFKSSLLEVREGGGCDGPTPTTADVVGGLPVCWGVA